jgi:prephenate dehydrogenase
VTPGQAPRRVVIVGTGLIGTSAALALRRHGTQVWLSDAAPAAAELAADLARARCCPRRACPVARPTWP